MGKRMNMLAGLLIWAQIAQPMLAHAKLKPVAKDCGVYFDVSALSKRNRIVDAAEFTEEKLSIIKSTQFWEKFMGRKIPHFESKRARTYQSVKKGLIRDRSHITAEYLKPVFSEVQLAYVMIKKNETLIEKLDGYIKLIAEDKDIIQHIDVSGDGFERLDLSDLKRAIVEKNAYAVQMQFHAYAEGLKDEILDYAKLIARNIDEYGTALSSLEKFSVMKKPADAPVKPVVNDEMKNEDDILGHEKASSSEIDFTDDYSVYNNRASKVLELLGPDKLLKDFFKKSGISPVKKVEIRDLNAVFDRYPEAELYRLKLQRRIEAFTALASISPTTALLDLLKKGISKVPFVDHKKLSVFISTIGDERFKVLYYPDIERIANSTTKTKDKVQMLFEMNAGTNDELITTFARRIDLADQWGQIKESAAKDFKDPRYKKKINEADQLAAKMDDLSLEGRSSSAKITMRFMDLLLASIAGYYGYQLAFGDKDLPAEAKKMAKEFVPELTGVEEQELDTLITESETALPDSSFAPPR